MNKKIDIKDKKYYLKKRVDIRCRCKKQKSNERDRVKFGTCHCDSYGLYFTLGHVIANYLYQYIADAKGWIIREDYELIEKHAKAIREYAETDSWDLSDKDKKIQDAYKKKEKAWKEAIDWMVNNWQGLWW